MSDNETRPATGGESATGDRRPTGKATKATPAPAERRPCECRRWATTDAEPKRTGCDATKPSGSPRPFVPGHDAKLVSLAIAAKRRGADVRREDGADLATAHATLAAKVAEAPERTARTADPERQTEQLRRLVASLGAEKVAEILAS